MLTRTSLLSKTNDLTSNKENEPGRREAKKKLLWELLGK